MIRLRKYSATLKVNPNDAYDLNLVLGECPDDDRHRLLKPKSDILRNNGYEPDESAEMLRAWLTRDEKYSGEVSDTIERSWAEWEELVIVGGKSVPNIKPDCQKVVDLFRKYGGLLALNTYLLKWMRMDMTTQEWLSRMYQPSDLLCLGRHMKEIRVLPLSTILGQFPSPPLKNRSPDIDKLVQDWENTKRGVYRTEQFCVLTPAIYRDEWMYYDGRNWGRCDPNILRRKYWVIEMDIAAEEKKGHWRGVLPHRDYDGFDLQAGVIRHLLELGFPIVSIVHSGKKSFHVWNSGKGLSNEEIRTLITSAIPLGGCPSSVGLSQFMRVPNPDHLFRPQYCYYFNPEFINND